MDIKDYISSGIIESYVLGVVSDQERREVECMSKIYPELQQHMLEVQGNLEQLAQSWEKEPPANLKGKVMKSLDKEIVVEKSIATRKAKIIKMRGAANSGGINARSVAAAAVILILAASALIFVRSKELNKVEEKLTALSEEVKEKDELTAKLNQELLESDEKQAFFTDDRTITVALAGTQISPEASVKAYWNKSQKKVVLTGMHLPQNEIDKQYQLWAIVDGSPVDLGMLDVYNPNQSLTKNVDASGVQAFAITLEQKGGNASPNMDQLYVVGNVGT